MSVSACSICDIQHSTAASTPIAISAAMARITSRLISTTEAATKALPFSVCQIEGEGGSYPRTTTALLALRLFLHVLCEPLLMTLHELGDRGLLFRSQDLEQLRLDARLLHDQFREIRGFLFHQSASFGFVEATA